MHPVLKISQLAEIGHFELLRIVNLIRIVFKRSIQSLGSYFAVMSDTNYLCFQQMLFLSREGRTRSNSCAQLSSKGIFDKSCSSELLRRD